MGLDLSVRGLHSARETHPRLLCSADAVARSHHRVGQSFRAGWRTQVGLRLRQISATRSRLQTRTCLRAGSHASLSAPPLMHGLEAPLKRKFLTRATLIPLALVGVGFALWFGAATFVTW